ncbi:MAG: beta-N-acetylhexosaminidase [Candidatus Acidiferrales bacterium]
MQNQRPIPATVLERFILGFPSTELPKELRRCLAAGLAGVVLYPRNFSSVQSLCELTCEIRRAAGRSVLIGIDQEGGTRFSLPEPFTQWPSAAELGSLNDPGTVERMAIALARELRAAGCNLDFAPMLDLHLQAESPVTKERSFGADPKRVAELGAAFARGLATEGILACVKHFPGHGDAKVDPHEALPIFDGTIERLHEMELVPFARAVRERVPLMMTAHIVLPNIDSGKPTTLSRKILHELLRVSMHFEGVIVADDLGMGAISQRVQPGEAAVGSFLAGSDLAMLCHEWGQVRPALETTAAALAARKFPGKEWEASGARIEKLLLQADGAFQDPPPRTVIGCAEYRLLAEEIRSAATLVHRK